MNAPDDGPWDAFYRWTGRDALSSPVANRDDAAYFLSGQRDVRRITERFALPLGGTALEIGCGDGRITRTLATMFTRVYALDVAPAVNACRVNLADYPHIQFLLGGARRLDLLPDRSIDVILSANMLQHVPARDEITWYISEAARLLSLTGVAVLQLRNPRALTRLHDFVLDAACAAASQSLPPLYPHWHGAVLNETQTRAATGLTDAEVAWLPERHHIWLVLRRTWPQLPPHLPPGLYEINDHGEVVGA